MLTEKTEKKIKYEYEGIKQGISNLDYAYENLEGFELEMQLITWFHWIEERILKINNIFQDGMLEASVNGKGE
jgi:hypothetical protein